MCRTKLALLLLPLLLSAATVTEERTGDEANDIRYGQTPSDIPTGGLLKDLKNTNVTPFENADVSAHGDKHVYIGYGVYDPDGEHCAAVDVASLDGTDAVQSGRFNGDSLQTFNGHAYLASTSDMSYAQCKTYASNYYAYPVSITSAGENEFLRSEYGGRPYWVGLTKTGPSQPYVNARGDRQEYFNFNSEDASWATNKANVISVNGAWIKSDGSALHRCVIEFETEDYTHPVKICAPWWSIERTYDRPPESRYLVKSVDENGNPTTVDIRKFNQADYPKRVSVCTKREAAPAGVAPGDKVEVTCNSYYDITRSPKCQADPRQDLCFVNECRGAIINSCVLTDTVDAPKGYGVDVVLDKNGVEQRVKRQLDVKMHKYSCDAYSATSPCIAREEVTMLPQPCPGTHMDPNDPNSRPIRVYGSEGHAADGSLEKLQGVCPDGSLVDVPVNVLARDTRVCLRYDWIETNTTWSEKCSLDRPYHDVTVSASLTEHDAYESDPDCVRLNNIEDAQPDRETIIKYRQLGYADMTLKKAYIEGTTSSDWAVDIGTGYIEHVLSHMQFDGESNATIGTGASPLTPAQQAELESLTINCDEDMAANFGHKRFYHDYLVRFMYDTMIKDVGHVANLTLDGYGNTRITSFNGVTWSQCQDLATRLQSHNPYPVSGGSVTAQPVITKEFPDAASRDWATMTPGQIAAIQTDMDTRYRFDELGVKVTDVVRPEDAPFTSGKCPIRMDMPTGRYSLMDVSGTTSLFQGETFTSNPFENCLKIAYCAQADLLNPMPYSGNQQCRLQIGRGESNAVDYVDARVRDKMDEFVQQNNANIKTPYEVRHIDEDSTFQDIAERPLAIDGTHEIFFLQEYVKPLRGWGYLPSYNFLAYTSSQVKANGHMIWPVHPYPYMRERLYLDWSNWRKTHHFKGSNSPFIGASAFVGEQGGFKDRPESYAYAFLSGGGSPLISGIILAFTGDQKEFEANVKAKAYGKVSDYLHYRPNYYPQYESRSPMNGFIEYSRLEYATNGRANHNDAGAFYDTVQKVVDDYMDTLNVYDPNAQPFHTYYPLRDLFALNLGYPKLDWWDVWSPKTKGPEEDKGTEPLMRKVTTHYMGAVNGLGIVVPYVGDYELQAFDANGIEISTAEIREQDFGPISANYYNERAAQVVFGSNMNVVVGGNPCSFEEMALVGGGVSGGYYEIDDPLTGYAGCAEADHLYVEEHAIKQIRIKVKNTDKFYVLDLDYPMPFANRAFLITYNQKQNKLYRCFEPFGQCTGGDYEKIDN